MANLQLNSRFLTIICGECRVGERFVARDAGPCDSALWAQWRRYLCYPSSSRYFARIVIGDAPRRLSGLVSRCDTRRILLAALGSLPEIIAKNRRLGCRNRRQGGWQRACARKRPAAGRVAGRLRSRGCCGRRAQKTPGSWSGCRASRASWALCAGVPRVGAGGYETVITTLSKRSSGVSAPLDAFAVLRGVRAGLLRPRLIGGERHGVVGRELSQAGVAVVVNGLQAVLAVAGLDHFAQQVGQRCCPPAGKRPPSAEPRRGPMRRRCSRPRSRLCRFARRSPRCARTRSRTQRERRPWPPRGRPQSRWQEASCRVSRWS